MSARSETCSHIQLALEYGKTELLEILGRPDLCFIAGDMLIDPDIGETVYKVILREDITDRLVYTIASKIGDTT